MRDTFIPFIVDYCVNYWVHLSIAGRFDQTTKLKCAVGSLFNIRLTIIDYPDTITTGFSGKAWKNDTLSRGEDLVTSIRMTQSYLSSKEYGKNGHFDLQRLHMWNP